jgi:hypothetical protein
MKLFNLINSQIVTSQKVKMTSQKCHPRTGQKNHLGHVGHVQNNVSKMTGWPFWWLFKMGSFLLIFPNKINHEF